MLKMALKEYIRAKIIVVKIKIALTDSEALILDGANTIIKVAIKPDIMNTS